VSLVARLRSGFSPAPPAPAAALRPDALPPGTRLGPARIERALGRGATSTVYLASDVDSGLALAVKVLCPAPGEDAAAANASFLREAQVASRLVHPHIVRTLGGGQVGGIAFLTMQALPGRDLRHHAQRERLLPEPAALLLCAQIAQALAYAHRQGVVHRDVKPANVIFDAASRHAAVTDFGLARAPDAQASRSGVFLGSPVYMAPELLAGQPPDARSDLYALGVMAYELLAGRPPFESASMGQLLRQVTQAAPPPLATLRPDWPADRAAQLDALLAPLLAKAASQRPADGDAWAAQAREVAEALAAEVPAAH
jgi:eukaryotic-like serine/threonine-protein kinase